MATRTDPLNLDARLDWLEERLPALPAASLRFQRSLAKQTQDTYCEAFTAMRESFQAMAVATANAVKTVAGTARWTGQRTADVATTGAKTVVGQGKAQARIAAEAVADEASKLASRTGKAATDTLDTATDAVDSVRESVERDRPGSGVPYEEWTKAELYERAQDLDIEGRATMSKSELIAALRSA